MDFKWEDDVIRFVSKNNQHNFYGKCEENRLEVPTLGVEDLLKGYWRGVLTHFLSYARDLS